MSVTTMVFELNAFKSPGSFLSFEEVRNRELPLLGQRFVAAVESAPKLHPVLRDDASLPVAVAAWAEGLVEDPDAGDAARVDEVL